VLEALAEDIGNATYRQIVIDAPLQAGSERISGRPRTYGLSSWLRHQALVRPRHGIRMPA
jgi:hypothetical protein